MKNIIFYNCTPINDYQERFKNTLQKIKHSGLYDNIDRIFFLLNGEVSEFVIDKKISYIYFYNSNNESNRLNFIKNFCHQNDNFNLLYLHSKGVTKPFNLNILSWINFLEYFVIFRYQECLNVLKHCQTCSANFKSFPFRHYSGNFWWARSEHIRTLDICDDYNYIASEKWLLSKGDPDLFYNFYTSNKNLYEELIYENEYTRN